MTDTIALAGQALLAHHPLVLALPALVPAVVVVGVVLYVARKDRRAEREERETLERGLDSLPDDLRNDDSPQGDT